MPESILYVLHLFFCKYFHHLPKILINISYVSVGLRGSYFLYRRNASLKVTFELWLEKGVQMAGQHGIFISVLKMNFRLRDFFLDFLACILPGSIFLFAITLLVGGVLFLFSMHIFALFTWSSENNQIIEYLVSSFSLNLWLILLFTFFAYFTGHLLYRQTPKKPDYASFLRIRQKVINDKDDWVIERGRGVLTQDVQFPYSNLKKYLESRGFIKLAPYIKWTPYTKKDKIDSDDNGQDKKNFEDIRSKTKINKAKIRIAFFYPENTINIIRNEAHIRLASSMWYAARYILTISYFVIALVIINFIYSSTFQEGVKPIIVCIIFGFLIIGIKYRKDAISEMKKYPVDSTEEKNASFTAKYIDNCWKMYDRVPFYCSSILVMCLSIIDIFCQPDKFNCPNFIVYYSSIIAFITMGALFAKHRIEETFHYQRVREILYVLETAFLAKILDDDNLPDIRELTASHLKINEAILLRQDGAGR